MKKSDFKEVTKEIYKKVYESMIDGGHIMCSECPLSARNTAIEIGSCGFFGASCSGKRKQFLELFKDDFKENNHIPDTTKKVEIPYNEIQGEKFTEDNFHSLLLASEAENERLKERLTVSVEAEVARKAREKELQTENEQLIARIKKLEDDFNQAIEETKQVEKNYEASQKDISGLEKNISNLAGALVQKDKEVEELGKHIKDLKTTIRILKEI